MFESIQPYVHVLDGRIRLKVPEVKRSPQTARELEEQLAARDAVLEVRANPRTGNVLVLYDSGQLDAHGVIQSIVEMGFFRHPMLAALRTLAESGTSHGLLESVSASLCQMALKQCSGLLTAGVG